MWRKYFKVVRLVPGRVVVQGHGEIDFSKDNLPVELCMKLYEADFRYLEITELGKTELYGLKTEQWEPDPEPEPEPAPQIKVKQTRRNTKKTKPDIED